MGINCVNIFWNMPSVGCETLVATKIEKAITSQSTVHRRMRSIFQVKYLMFQIDFQKFRFNFMQENEVAR